MSAAIGTSVISAILSVGVNGPRHGDTSLHFLTEEHTIPRWGITLASGWYLLTSYDNGDTYDVQHWPADFRFGVTAESVVAAVDAYETATRSDAHVSAREAYEANGGQGMEYPKSRGMVLMALATLGWSDELYDELHAYLGSA